MLIYFAGEWGVVTGGVAGYARAIGYLRCWGVARYALTIRYFTTMRFVCFPCFSMYTPGVAGLALPSGSPLRV